MGTLEWNGGNMFHLPPHLLCGQQREIEAHPFHFIQPSLWISSNGWRGLQRRRTQGCDLNFMCNSYWGHCVKEKMRSLLNLINRWRLPISLGWQRETMDVHDNRKNEEIKNILSCSHTGWKGFDFGSLVSQLTSDTMKWSLFSAEFIKTPTPHTLTFYVLLGSVIGGEKKKCVANPTECCGNHPQYVSVFLIHYPAEIHMPFSRPYKDLIQTSKSDPRSTLSKEYRYQNSGLKDLKKKVETFDTFQSGGLDDEDASSTRPAFLAPKGLARLSKFLPCLIFLKRYTSVFNPEI